MQERTAPTMMIAFINKEFIFWCDLHIKMDKSLYMRLSIMFKLKLNAYINIYFRRFGVCTYVRMYTYMWFMKWLHDVAICDDVREKIRS